MYTNLYKYTNTRTCCKSSKCSTSANGSSTTGPPVKSRVWGGERDKFVCACLYVCVSLQAHVFSAHRSTRGLVRRRDMSGTRTAYTFLLTAVPSFSCRAAHFVRYASKNEWNHTMSTACLSMKVRWGSNGWAAYPHTGQNNIRKSLLMLSNLMLHPLACPTKVSPVSRPAV